MTRREKELRHALSDKTRSIEQKLTDIEVLTSGLTSRCFANRACAITQRYDAKSRVQVTIAWKEKEDNLAFAMGNEFIYINIGNRYFDSLIGMTVDEVMSKMQNEVAGYAKGYLRSMAKSWIVPLSRETRYELLYGLFGHEIGHILYTSSEEEENWQFYCQKLDSWYPVTPAVALADQQRKEMLEEFMWVSHQGIGRDLLCKIQKFLMNIIEDGYVEKRMINEYPGMLGYSLQKMRLFSACAERTMESLDEDLEQNKLYMFEVIEMAMLKYITTQTVYWGAVPATDEVRIRFEEVKPLLDQALLTHDQKGRLEIINLIMIKLANELVQMLTDMEKNQKKSSDLQKRMQKLEGTDRDDIKGTSPNLCNQPPKDEENTQNVSKKEHEQSAGESSSQTGKSSGSDEKTGDNRQPEQKAGDNQSKGASEGKSQSPDELKGDDRSEQDSQKEEDRNPYDAELKQAKEEVEKLFQELAYEKAVEEAESSRNRKLQSEAQKMKLDSEEMKISVKIARTQVTEQMVSDYETMVVPLRELAKKMQRSLLQKLHQKRNVIKVKGLYMGNKLEVSSAVKQDGRLFSRKKQPSDGVELAVGVIIDESGSMIRRGRYLEARKMAVLLHEFCRGLSFPVLIYGHDSARQGQLRLYSYVEFDALDGNDGFRLTGISARDGNRDGAAIRYMSERLLSRSEPVKLLIIISDGLPSAYQPISTGVPDTKEAVKEAKRKGITVIAAGIGDDQAKLCEIYEDYFLDISDLKMLPITMVSMLKRFIEKNI